MRIVDRGIFKAKYFTIFVHLLIFTLLSNILFSSTLSNSSEKSKYSLKSMKVPLKVRTSRKEKKIRRKQYDKYLFDKAKRLIGVDSIDKGKYRITYNELGRKISESYGNNEKRKFYYDILGRLIKKVFIKGKDRDEVIYKYSTSPDSYILGNMTEKIEKNEHSFFRYKNGKLIEEKKIIRGKKFLVRYSYNKMGLIYSLQYPSGLKVFYEYDERNKINKISIKKGTEIKEIFSKELTNFGGKIKFGNGLEKEWKTNQEKSELIVKTEGIQNYRVKYNDNGLIRKVVNKLNPRTSKEFFYDRYERLITAYGPWGKISYRYDDMDNLLKKEEMGKVLKLKYGDKSSKIRELTENDKPVKVDYDELGNMTIYKNMKFEYGVRGRLVKILKNNKVVSEMFYNIKNQRVIEKNDGRYFYYIYDKRDRMIAKYDENGNIVIEYIYNNYSPMIKKYNENIVKENVFNDYYPVARISDGEIFYFHYDPMNFPVRITDSNKNIVRDVEYKPYGEISIKKGIYDPLRFQGQLNIKGTFISYNFNRTYIPILARYIESDRAITYENSFTYARGNPILFSDKTGLQSEEKEIHEYRSLLSDSKEEKLNSLRLYIGTKSLTPEFFPPLIKKVLKFLGGGIAIGGIAANIESEDCYRKDNLWQFFSGWFRGVLIGLNADIGLPISENLFEMKYKSIKKMYKFPTIKEFVYGNILSKNRWFSYDYNKLNKTFVITFFNTKITWWKEVENKIPSFGAGIKGVGIFVTRSEIFFPSHCYH